MSNYILFLLFFIPCILFANIGKISSLKGEVYIKNNKETKTAKIGSFLYQKDTVITKNNSQALLLLNDDTSIAVGKNTQMSLNEYLYDPKISSNNNLKVGFLKGTFRTITGQIGKLNKEKFKVDTPTATIGIRGTTFLLKIEQEQLQVGVEKGGVFLNSSQANDKSIDIFADQFITIINSTGEYLIEPFSKWIEGQKIKTDLEKMVEITNSLPSWILRPKAKGSISSIGIAGYNKHGLEIMMLEAQMDAKAKLAGQLQMQISQAQEKIIRTNSKKDSATMEKAFMQASKEVIKNIPLKNFERINMYQAKDGTLYIHMIIDEKEISDYLWDQRRTYMKQMIDAGFSKEEILNAIKLLGQEIKNIKIK